MFVLVTVKDALNLTKAQAFHLHYCNAQVNVWMDLEI